LGPKGVYLLTDEQVEDILEWLKHDFWSKALRLYACVWCGTQTKPHKGAGLCSSCYWKHRRYCAAQGIPESVEAQCVWVEQALESEWSASESNFLETAKIRLLSGKSLSPEQLKWMRRFF
jgi:hypothetical protein